MIPNEKRIMRKIIFVAAILDVCRWRPCPDNAGSIGGRKYTCGCNPRTQKSDYARGRCQQLREAQAEDRISEAGYTEVKDLKLDDKGIWIASGMKDGKAVSIALDYQGNDRRHVTQGEHDENRNRTFRRLLGRLCSAVSKLEAAGIPSDDISIVSNKGGRVDNGSDAGEGAATGAGRSALPSEEALGAHSPDLV